MNIDDAKLQDLKMPEPGALVSYLYVKQTELAEKYIGIERHNGFSHPGVVGPINLDDHLNQAFIKDFFWRVTEETAEALEHPIDDGVLHLWRRTWGDSSAVRHFFEELADALHFLIEVSIFSGLTPLDVQREWDLTDVSELHLREDGSFTIASACIFSFVMQLGLAANHLKNKPWKTTQMHTDVVSFKLALLKAWRYFIELWKYFEFTDEDVYLLYCKKHEVNTFRQRSKY